MKQSLSPGVVAAIIVVVVAVLGFFGYRMVGGSKQSSGKAPPEAQKWLNPGTAGHAMGAKAGSGPGPGSPMGRPGGPPGAMGAPPPGAYGGGYGASGSPYGSAPR